MVGKRTHIETKIYVTLLFIMHTTFIINCSLKIMILWKCAQCPCEIQAESSGHYNRCIFLIVFFLVSFAIIMFFSQKWLFNGSEIMHAASFHNISRFHTNTQKLRSNQVHMRVLMGRKDPIIKSRKVILRFFEFLYCNYNCYRV